MTQVRAIFSTPWIWSFVGAFAVWLATVIFTGGVGGGGMITAALSLAVFMVIVGVGQMFVITLGPGNVDLSLPANIGLASAEAMTVMGGQDSRIALGLLAALASGAAVGIALVVHFGLMRTSYGAILRGSGGNPVALGRAGWSILRVKMTLFALAGLFGVLSGMTLVGITTAGDANIGNGYTLLAIAGVILGGGEFVGGRVSPIGAVLGALTLALAASPLLTFMKIPPDWQVAANGIILIVVLAARVLISRRER